MAAFADQQHQLLRDFTASAPSPPPAAPANSRRVAKRRPRPSRRSPTTYISADPANFRRMVHQVTGAPHDLLLSPLPPTTELLINRPAGSTTGTGTGALNTLLLRTLDTSAFLIGAARTAGLPLPTLAVEADNNSSSAFLFPTLESWDHHADLF